MKETLTLKKPIAINGAEKKEICYDFDELTAQDLLYASKDFRNEGNAIQMQEFDPAWHTYIFVAAVTKADPSQDKLDIMRMSAKDIIKAQGLVRNFFFFDSEDIAAASI